MFHFGSYCLDPAGARLLKDGDTVPLPPKALAALIYLVEHRGRLIAKDELLDAVWGHRFVSQGVLKNTITTLRQALDDDPKNPLYIETVHRLGYRFIAELKTGNAASQSVLPCPSSGPVGRAEPLAELHRLLEKSLAGEPQLAFVTGEAGIGKTTLIETFLQSAADRILCGHGQCVEQFGQGEPYLPVLEALNELVRSDEARLVSLMRQVAPTWLVQLPWYLGGADQGFLHQTLSGTSQMRMLREFGEFLGRCSEDSPLVLVLEDLHWSDRATLDLLAYLARRKQPARWLILSSYRPEDIMLDDHDLKHVLRELQIQGLLRVLALEPLSEAAIGEYLAQRLEDRDLAGSWAPALHARSGGLPFFLVQLIETLQSEQNLARNAALLPSALPEGVQQLLERQFERLSVDYRRVLEAASVVGMNFSAETVASALAVNSIEVEACCENLARLQHFLRPVAGGPGRYGFRHAFHHEFAYAHLPPLQCARLHRAVGEWLESSRKNPEGLAAELALHFERGREWEKAVNYLQRAAGNACARHALHEAELLLRRGLNILKQKLPDGQKRNRLTAIIYIDLIPILRATRGYAAIELEQLHARVMEQAGELEDISVFPVLWSRWAFHCVRAEFGVALACAEQFLAATESSSESIWQVSAFQAMGTTLWHLGKPREARTFLQRGLALCETQPQSSLFGQLGEDSAIASYFFNGMVLWLLGLPDQARESVYRAVILAETLKHPYSKGMALLGAACIHVDRREPESVIKYSQALGILAAEHGFLLWQIIADILQGWALAASAQTDTGISLIQRGMANFLASGANMLQPYFFTLLADALAKNGQTPDGLMALAEAQRKVEQLGEYCHAAEVQRLRGELLLQINTSNQTEAEACFQKALSLANHQGALSLELRAAISLARLSLDQGRGEQAKELLGEVYGRFTEGYDTPDLREARALLCGEQAYSNAAPLRCDFEVSAAVREPGL